MNDLFKKVLSVLYKIKQIGSKVLFKQEIERNVDCVYCGNDLTGKQRRFCSDKCNNAYWRDKYSGKKRVFGI